MNTLKVLLSAGVAAALIGGGAMQVRADEGDDEKLFYSATPEDPEWSDMSYSEQLQACYIGEDLSQVSTGDLLSLAEDYPFIIDIMVFNTYIEGLNHLIQTSDVIGELAGRADLNGYLIDNLDDDDDYMHRLLTETLIAYRWSEGELSEQEKAQVMNVYSTKTYDAFAGRLPEILGSFGIGEEDIADASSDIADDSAQGEPTRSEYFIAGASGVTWDGGETYYTGGVYHKYDRNVSCYRYESGEFSDYEIYVYDTNMTYSHPSWSFQSSASKKYNCHSYVWITSVVANNIYWLPNPTNYATNTSYFSAQTANGPVSVGQYLMIYNGSTLQHSVRVTTASSGTSYQTTAKVVSKLGQMGVYKTSLYDMMQLYNGTVYQPYTVL